MEADGRECLEGFWKEGKKYREKERVEKRGCKGNSAGMFSITYLFFCFFFFFTWFYYFYAYYDSILAPEYKHWKLLHILVGFELVCMLFYA